MRTAFSIFTAAVFAVISAVAVANVDIGPAIGSKIPGNFTALDKTGAKKQLNDIVGEMRSADWCPYCKQQMINLQTIEGDLKSRGYNLATVSYDAPPILDRFSRERDITYIMLSDEQSAMIDAWHSRSPI
jgi:peroxiredoxin